MASSLKLAPGMYLFEYDGVNGGKESGNALVNANGNIEYYTTFGVKLRDELIPNNVVLADSYGNEYTVNISGDKTKSDNVEVVSSMDNENNTITYNGIKYKTDSSFYGVEGFTPVDGQEYGIVSDGTIVKILGRDKNGNVLATFVSDRGESNDQLYIRKYNLGDFKDGRTTLTKEEALGVTKYEANLVDDIEKKITEQKTNSGRGNGNSGAQDPTDTSNNEFLKGEFAKQLDECLGNEGEKATAVKEEYESYKTSFDQLTSTMNSLKQSGKWKDTGDIVVQDLQKRYDTLKTNLDILKTVSDTKDKLKTIRDNMKSEEQRLATAKAEKERLEGEKRACESRHHRDEKTGREEGCDGSCGRAAAGIKEQDDIIKEAREKLEGYKNEADTLLQTINTEEAKVKDYKFKDEIQYLDTQFNVLDGNKATKFTPTGPGGGGRGDGEGGDAPVEEQKPIELPDRTADQIKIYEEMTIDELDNLTELLSTYANYKGITLSELLKDIKYQDEVISYLVTSSTIPASLRTALAEGDPTKSFGLLNSLYSGGQPNVVGLTENTKKTLATYLTNVAEDNNISFKDLMSDGNTKVLKAALNKFDGVKNNLLSANNYKNNFIDIYDGNNISTLASETVDIERIYGDVVSESQNKDIESYFDSKSLDEDFKTLGKFSSFSNTVSGYDNTSLRNVVYTMLT